MKAYETHELAYARMKAEGIESWDQFRGAHADPEVQIDPELQGLLEAAVPSFPPGGTVLELGCGTAPVLRWLCGQGFRGIGVDISASAIALLEELGRGLEIRGLVGDVCAPGFEIGQVVDVVIDGHCLHCITEMEDRRALLESAHRMLRPGGLLLISTMTQPLDSKLWAARFERQKVLDEVVWVPWSRADECEEVRDIDGVLHIPTRILRHPDAIVAEVEAAGFEVRVDRRRPPTEDDPTSDLGLVATKRSI